VHLSAISVYPVKSCRGLAVDSAAVEATGLAEDRRWMVLDPAGEVLTARTVPALFRVTPTPLAGGGLSLATAGRASLVVASPGAEAGRSVAVVGMSGMDRALAGGPAADRWLTEVLDRPVQLVGLDAQAPRTLAGRHGGQPGDLFNLSDAGPVLLASTVSLLQLDRWVAEGAAARSAEAPTTAGAPTKAADAPTMAMERFRPNVVVDGAGEAFEEERWTAVRIGAVDFRLGEVCDRCAMTLLDPETLARGKEPIRTLARHRRRDGAVWFGTRLIPTTSGTIRVGDPVSAS